MKALVALLVIGSLGWIVFTGRVDSQNTALRQQMIAEHRIGLGMTREQVRASLGAPASIGGDKFGREIWLYNDRRVEFSRGKMIGSTMTAAPVVASSAPSREITYEPQLHRYIEHDSNVSARTAAGLNAASKVRVPDAPRGGTMLDQPARR